MREKKQQLSSGLGVTTLWMEKCQIMQLNMMIQSPSQNGWIRLVTSFSHKKGEHVFGWIFVWICRVDEVRDAPDRSVSRTSLTALLKDKGHFLVFCSSEIVLIASMWISIAILILPLVVAEDKAEVNIRVSGACSPSKILCF